LAFPYRKKGTPARKLTKYAGKRQGVSGLFCFEANVKPYYQSDLMTLYHGDTLSVLPRLDSASIDAIISDPPYPEIDRPYGRLTEFQWSILMTEVCRQSRRVLKPKGSAVFVLQPNSHKVGSMRGWLFEFQAWICREWNMVQDVWWWNYNAIPTAHTQAARGLMRPSTKACVWCGDEKCHRDQDAVLLKESERNKTEKRRARINRVTQTSGHSTNELAMYQTAENRGGSVPFNLLPVSGAGGNSKVQYGFGHGAGTPFPLADWWTRYICPPDSIILDPFVGAGTMMLAGLLRGHRVIGIDKKREYLDITIKRCKSAEQQRHGEFHIQPKASKPQKVPTGQMELFTGGQELKT
jgi:DNA modification methylase